MWSELPKNSDTMPMYDYLNASLAPVDQLYLLDGSVTDLLSAGVPLENADHEASKLACFYRRLALSLLRIL